MKLRYVYTVIREFETKSGLKQEISCFEGVEDEVGEHLYGGSSQKESIKVKLQKYEKGEWKDIS